ncbi:MAG TPA: response regulator, partial [Casimicrobiaceae bacterium]|nr:response regulator [Casimicrobiaceae bacterium]
ADGGEEGADVIDFAPARDARAEAAVKEPTANLFAREAVTIGDVTLTPDLFAVLIDEADGHLATLAHELSVLQFDSRQLPSAAMVRASHTLCGIHRTSGLPLIALTAGSLEQCLLALQRHASPMPESALPVLANSILGLGELVARVKSRSGFNAADSANASEIQVALDTLKNEAATEHGPIDAETQAAREFVASETAAREVPAAEEPARSGEATGQAAPAGTHESSRPEEVADEATAVSPTVQIPEPPAVVHVPAEAERAVALEAVADAAAAPPTHAAPVEAAAESLHDALAAIRDDVDEQVLPIFLEEAAELYPQAGEQVRGWRRSPGDSGTAQKLQRTLHTFKGSARMAGAMRLGELAHRMESRLSPADTPITPTPEFFEALDTDLDRIGYVLDALRAGKTNVTLPEALAAAPAVAGPAPAEAAAAPATGGEKHVVVPAGVPQAPAPTAAEVEAGAHAMLRVRADIIDRLVNEAGEVAITRARIEGELRALKANLLELTGSVVRLRAQVREFEIQAESQIQSRLSKVGEGDEKFDPLEFDRYTRFQELARSLAEGVNDVSTIQQSLLRNLDVTDAALLSQARLSRDVAQQLFSIRTVPFGSLTERLYRILRGTAKELDKRANLEIGGAQTELDRSVLEKLVGPLEHLLRNALDHGIERRDARRKSGKSETGEITLTVRQVGNEIAIELIDDGAGLDLERIRAKAVAQGRFKADDKPSDEALIACIFEPGFSTASKVTQVSGRGIGMDVVRSQIEELGGRVEVSTRLGQGTTFMLYLPLTLAVAQTVLVRAGGRLWALPAPMVEKVEQMKPEQLVELYVQRRVPWQGLTYPFHYLPRLLGDRDSIPESTRTNAVLLLRSGQSLAAIHVDEMIGNQEVVVKNIGPQLARVSGIAGATVLGTGEIVLIINPVQLAQRTDVPVFEPNAERVAPEVPRAAVVQPGKPLVMIVDDSLTVRRITSRLLTREGFDVVSAKDGLDALELMQTETPDVILLDIEMPRMDGFEFTRKIKADAKHAGIPIVMITSRTAEKHRNLARALGVELYLGKPFQEDELLTHLREMLALTP